MSIYARDSYIMAHAAGQRLHDPFGRRQRRCAALAIYVDAAGVGDADAAWEFVEHVFLDLAQHAARPEQRKMWHRTLDALTLRYVHGLTLTRIGESLREPVTRERVRQILAKGLRVLRHPVRFQTFRAAVAQSLTRRATRSGWCRDDRC